MKVIFLDFDGVLNSAAFLLGKPGTKDELDPAAVARLNALVERSGAVVVVTSTWRFGRPRADLQRILDKVGFSGHVLDRTPEVASSGLVDPGWTRSQEIKAWLGKNPSVERYVVLDDLLLEEFAHVQVKTEFEDGLSDGHVEMALGFIGDSA
jgi:hypothetical protein